MLLPRRMRGVSYECSRWLAGRGAFGGIFAGVGVLAFAGEEATDFFQASDGLADHPVYGFFDRGAHFADDSCALNDLLQAIWSLDKHLLT